MKMASLHGTLKLDHARAIVLLLEGIGIEAITREPVGVALGALSGDDCRAGLIVDDIVALFGSDMATLLFRHDEGVGVALLVSCLFEEGKGEVEEKRRGR